MLHAEAIEAKFHELLDFDQELKCVAEGGKFFEGPIWNGREQHLTYSDIPASIMYRYSEKEGVSVVKRNTNCGNGNAYDASGRILSCEHLTHRVVRMLADGSEYEVMASHFEGKELNSPNDIIVGANGMIYFTDPNFGRRPTAVGNLRPMELSFQGVYMLAPDSKDIRLATDQVSNPNGLALSRDERMMYIADTTTRHLVAMDVDFDGALRTPRVLSTMLPKGDGVIDGVKLDAEGNIWCTAPGGVQVFDKGGMCLGVVFMPFRSGNLCFGGADLKTLFVCSGGTVQALRTKVAGWPLRY